MSKREREPGAKRGAAIAPETTPQTLNRAEPAKPGENGARFREIGGTEHEAFNLKIMSQVANATWFGDLNSDNASDVEAARAKASIAAVKAIAPQDAIEAMLAMQMVGIHNAAAECIGRAMARDRPRAARDWDLNHANKLARTYATLAQTLDKHRGRGQQTLRVEHVHLAPGSQAVIGSVTQNGSRPTSSEPLAIEEGSDPAMPTIEELAVETGGRVHVESDE